MKGRVTVPKDVCIQIPRTYQCVTFYQKWGLWSQMEHDRCATDFKSGDYMIRWALYKSHGVI